ncbi:hypothetical protein HDE76_001123 [Rhodanobacter sp. ANJX3]|uniref:DUF2894 domain-containing protein n=1 Tax=unclassified Rhodanobacter TaxID=2621553 RepID=UPI0015CCC1BB|nr:MULTISPECIES: DUF2894 domain-containing protein [unclassified Rhodanobacter]MBB5357917.1 hypothetical protein [Rhodanobacter sp. ANJX3]NYE30546.1 hypothetical protein [Rhodanobacter sp. K2T2]
MSDSASRIRKILDAWRQQNADRLSPWRFHFIEVLEQRAAGHDGATRQLLDKRLTKLVEAYAADLDNAASCAGDADGVSAPSAPARGALGELLDDIANRAATRVDDLATTDATPGTTALPTLEALDEFRNIWSEVRIESQIRQSLEQVPADAGPLNSGSLVHRSLTLMHELSPGYLQHFLSYIDTLSWMEQMSDGGAPSPKDGARVPSKRTRAKAPRAP